jgi:hypothetical protein
MRYGAADLSAAGKRLVRSRFFWRDLGVEGPKRHKDSQPGLSFKPRRTAFWPLQAFLAPTMMLYVAAICTAQVPATPSLRPTQFPTLQRRVLQVAGTRLQTPGLESFAINGLLDKYTSGTKTSTQPVTITLQYPGWMQMAYSGSSQSVVYNGSQVGDSAGAVSQVDTDLVESVVKDTPDNFLLGQFSGSTVRLIGANYGFKDPRSTNRLTGQCALFEVVELNGVRPGSQTSKIYCFDPLTSLLRAVLYRVGSSTIETRYSGWRIVAGQAVLSSVQRWNNSQQELGLTIVQANFGSSQPSTLFALP